MTIGALGAFALATGQSGGREGPGVHLGGAANSLMGQQLGLPNNSLRVLIACGTAGGIAAAFNTPLAGVVFAIEEMSRSFESRTSGTVLTAVIVAGIVCFSIGEMLSSPKSSEYLGNIAPRQKKAMYLGFSQLPLGFGWVLEGYFGQTLYYKYGAIDTVARPALVDAGMSEAEAAAIA